MRLDYGLMVLYNHSIDRTVYELALYVGCCIASSSHDRVKRLAATVEEGM